MSGLYTSCTPNTGARVSLGAAFLGGLPCPTPDAQHSTGTGEGSDRVVIGRHVPPYATRRFYPRGPTTTTLASFFYTLLYICYIRIKCTPCARFVCAWIDLPIFSRRSIHSCASSASLVVHSSLYIYACTTYILDSIQVASGAQ